MSNFRPLLDLSVLLAIPVEVEVLVGGASKQKKNGATFPGSQQATNSDQHFC
jgi:hypothetical protein